MPGKARYMFCYKWGPDDIIGDIIDAAEGSGDDPTHVAVVLDDSLLEALPRGIVQSPLDKYQNRRHIIIEVDVPNPQCGPAMVQMLLGRRYGWISCLAGLLRDRFGIKVPWVSSSFDNCSETGVIHFRGQGGELFGFESPISITPADFMRELLKIGGQVVDEKTG